MAVSFYIQFMKRFILIILVFLSCCAASAAVSPQEEYVDRYAAVAVKEMYRSGVPASITLAQGILESNAGQSRLAVKGNNHFGIKCHNWNGEKMYHNDDRNGECFRVYATAYESFYDHSDFLRYRDRYKFLFDLNPKDYKGWAYGLKKAGYATDPAYPKKLIKIIQDYELNQYDGKSLAWANSQLKGKPYKPKKEKPKKGKAPKTETPAVTGAEGDRPEDSAYKESGSDKLPDSPNRLEEAKLLDNKSRETFHFTLTREMASKNGVPFVRSIKGETYESIAKANNLFLKEILKYNDLKDEEYLQPGTIVYLQPKKNQSVKGLDKYIVDGYDMNLREISQRFAVKLSSLCKMNNMTPDEKLTDGEVIKLRK